MTIAVNPTDGSVVYYDEDAGSWVPARVATNAESKSVAFDGKGWVPFDMPEKPAAAPMPQRAGSIGEAFRSVWDNPAPGIVSRGPLDPSLMGMAKSVLEGVQAPGRILAGEYNVSPEIPGQWSEADEFRARHAREKMQADAGALAGTVMGGSMPNAIVAGGRVSPNTLGMNFSPRGPMPGASTVKPPPAAPVGQIVEAAERSGIDLPRFLIDPSRTTQGLAAGLQNIPGAGDKIAAATSNTVRGLGDATARVAEGFGTGSPAVAGSYAKDAISGWITGDSKKVAERLYNSVDEVINPAINTPIQSTAQAAQAILARRAEARIPGRSAAVDTIMDAATTPGGMSYQGIKGLRSFLGEMTPAELAASGLKDAEVKQLYGALTKDLRNAVTNAGGPEGLARFEKANRIFKQITDRRDSLSKIIGTKGDAAPEAVFSKLVAMAGSKSNADIGRLTAARKTVGADAWNELASAIVQKLGRDTRGEFSVQRFLTAYGNMPTAGRRSLFTSTGRDNLGRSLDDIAFVAKQIEARLGEFRNPSGTARSLSATGMVMDILHHPLRALGTILGGNRIAAALAEPASARATADWIKAYRDSLLAPSASAMRAQKAAAQKLADEIIRRTEGGPAEAQQLAAQLSLIGASAQPSANTPRPQ